MIPLTACAITTTKCPPLVSYSDQFQDELAEELKKLSPKQKKTIGKVVTDTGKFRKVCRAIATVR